MNKVKQKDLILQIKNAIASKVDNLNNELRILTGLQNKLLNKVRVKTSPSLKQILNNVFKNKSTKVQDENKKFLKAVAENEKKSHSGILVMGLGHDGEYQLDDGFKLININSDTITLSISILIHISKPLLKS